MYLFKGVSEGTRPKGVNGYAESSSRRGICSVELPPGYVVFNDYRWVRGVWCQNWTGMRVPTHMVTYTSIRWNVHNVTIGNEWRTWWHMLCVNVSACDTSWRDRVYPKRRGKERRSTLTIASNWNVATQSWNEWHWVLSPSSSWLLLAFPSYHLFSPGSYQGLHLDAAAGVPHTGARWGGEILTVRPVVESHESGGLCFGHDRIAQRSEFFWRAQRARRAQNVHISTALYWMMPPLVRHHFC